MFSLIGKRILVTGASSGIGRATALMLAENGATLVVTGRDKNKLDDLILLIGKEHSAFSYDLANESDIVDLSKTIGQIDGLVHCAGIIDYCLYKNLNRQKYDRIFDVNFYSAIQLTNLLIKLKKINKGSSLVYISSISSSLGVPATALYSASKAALNAAVRVLASELAPKGIRANTILPGIVRTPMISDATELIDSDSFNLIEKSYPLGLGAPEDVASLCLFLLADGSKWMTGTSLLLDGGYSLI